MGLKPRKQPPSIFDPEPLAPGTGPELCAACRKHFPPAYGEVWMPCDACVIRRVDWANRDRRKEHLQFENTADAVAMESMTGELEKEERELAQRLGKHGLSRQQASIPTEEERIFSKSIPPGKGFERDLEKLEYLKKAEPTRDEIARSIKAKAKTGKIKKSVASPTSRHLAAEVDNSTVSPETIAKWQAEFGATIDAQIGDGLNVNSVLVSADETAGEDEEVPKEIPEPRIRRDTIHYYLEHPAQVGNPLGPLGTVVIRQLLGEVQAWREAAEVQERELRCMPRYKTGNDMTQRADSAEKLAVAREMSDE